MDDVLHNLTDGAVRNPLGAASTPDSPRISVWLTGSRCEMQPEVPL